jgi:hypothetical protein
MTVKEVGIIVHGATGRIGATQHLANALAPIRAEGGVVSGADRIMPRLLLVGRDAARLEEITTTRSGRPMSVQRLQSRVIPFSSTRRRRSNGLRR